MEGEIINSALLSSTMVIIGLILGFALLKLQGE
jgi:hypothetical protein